MSFKHKAYIVDFFPLRLLSVCVLVTLCDPMNCSLPSCSVHGILQASTLEWVATPFCKDLPDPGIKHWSPVSQADSLLAEPPGKTFK